MPTLHWLTKDKDLQEAAKTAYRLLVEVPSLGTTNHANDNGSCFDNMLVEGDNLEALRALLPFYAGQVKCIYIDPPYNTGSAFEHYDDNLEHAQWLAMMYPRLELLREFLSEDGVFFMQLDDDEVHYAKIICDEIFGRKNFTTTICVKMSHLSGVKMSHINKRPPKLKEFILMYAKNNNYIEINPDYEPVSWFDSLERYTQYIDNYEKSYEDWKVQPVKKVAAANNIDLKDETAFEQFLIQNSHRIIRTARNRALAVTGIKGKFSKIISATGLEKLIYNDEEVLFASDKIMTINKEKVPFNAVGDLWTDIGINNLHNEGEIDFRNGKKPERLIQRILTLSTNEGDLVMDSFLGSGTTAAVAHKMGRRYIGIEMGEQARTHCVVRLRKVIEGEQGGISKAVGWKGGGGFRFFTLGEMVFDSEGRINEHITFTNLAAHIWFSETKTTNHVNHTNEEKCSYGSWLGTHNGIAYALLFNGILHDRRVDGGNVLTSKTLEIIKSDIPGQDYDCLVIYGESTRLGADRLKAEKIQFKQIPYDIKR